MRATEVQFEPLPALKSLGELAEALPTVVIDSREQAPLTFRNLPSQAGTLQSGDYSVAGLEHCFAVERKSVPDLVACCVGDNRVRFERELHRLRGFNFKRLLVVGTEGELLYQNRSKMSPKVALSTLSAFEVRYSIPVVWCPNERQAAELVERWA